MLKFSISKLDLHAHAFFALTSLLASLRPLWVGTDTNNYIYFFESSLSFDSPAFTFFEHGYALVLLAIRAITNSFHVYLFLTAYIVFSLLYTVFKLTYSVPGYQVKQTDLLFYFSLLLPSPWVFVAIANGIRQGLALCVLYLLIALYWRLACFKRRISNSIIFLFFVPPLLHKSTLLVYPFLLFLPLRLPLLSLIWAISFFLYAFGLIQPILSALPLTSAGLYFFINSYAEGSKLYVGLVPLQFAYTIFWPLLSLVLFLYFPSYYHKVNRHPAFSFCLRLYMCLSLVYSTFGFAAYSNRYAFSAWLITPLLQFYLIKPLMTSRIAWLAPLASIASLGYYSLFRLQL